MPYAALPQTNTDAMIGRMRQSAHENLHIQMAMQDIANEQQLHNVMLMGIAQQNKVVQERAEGLMKTAASAAKAINQNS